jgi:hypothetical protein
MSFLALNGLPYPVAIQSLGVKIEEVGEAKRAIDGTMLVDRRATKEVVDFSTTPRPAPELRFLRDVLLGRGDVWSFASHLYSSKGRPAPVIGPSIAGAGKWGGAALSMTNGQQVSFPLESPALGATVIAWWSEDAGTTWQVEAFTLLGASTFGGMSLSSWFRVSTAGVVSTSPRSNQWGATSTGVLVTCKVTAALLSDVWVIPRTLNGITNDPLQTSWLPALALVDQARAPSPQLVLTGDWLNPSTRVSGLPSLLVRGEAGGGSVLPAWRAGAFSKTEHVLAATLTEI